MPVSRRREREGQRMARIGKEMWAKMPARIGLLAELADSVAGAGANIEAMNAYEMDGVGTFMFVTDDNPAAMRVAQDMGAEVGETDVVVVDLADSPGNLADAAARVSGVGVNIEYAYASTCGCGSASILMKCDDVEKAVAALS
jgi:hypothetical protein